MKPIVTTRLPSAWWLLVFVVFTLIFIALQVPASWLVAKFLPQQIQSQQLQNISGSVWHGTADFSKPTSQGMLTGDVAWQVKPFDFLKFGLGVQLTIHTAETNLKSHLFIRNKGYVQLKEVNGTIDAQTLTALTSFQWPESALRLKDINLTYTEKTGITDALGELAWGGGSFGYPMNGAVQRINLPPLVGVLSTENGQFNLAITDNKKKRMADFALTADKMVDIKLTQRLLLNIPNYPGQAGLDTAVIASRQPLASIIGGGTF